MANLLQLAGIALDATASSREEAVASSVIPASCRRSAIRDGVTVLKSADELSDVEIT